MNFNDPIEATQIFRVVAKREDNGRVVEATEFGFKTTFGWEDVKQVSEYFWQDDWTSYQGPKFYLRLATRDGEDLLIFGHYESFLNHWRQFRSTYPLFISYEQPKPRQDEGESPRLLH